jgi:HAMP domain-containing protein
MDCYESEPMKHTYKPCPFCGGEEIFEDNVWEDDSGFFCAGCGYGFRYEDCDTEAQRSDVRARWNTRPIEDALRAENARLREIERKALEQSEYIQTHGLTEWELRLKDTEIERLRGALRRMVDEAERVCLSDGGQAYVALANATEAAIEALRHEA